MSSEDESYHTTEQVISQCQVIVIADINNSASVQVQIHFNPFISEFRGFNSLLNQRRSLCRSRCNETFEWIWVAKEKINKVFKSTSLSGNRDLHT